MGNGLPSLPLYTSDLLTAVAAWPTERVGAYCLALFYQWEHGHVPVDDESLALILHAPKGRARKLWRQIAGKFEIEHNQARNVRLEEHRKEVEGKVAKSSEHGRKGARAKWHQHRLSTARVDAPAVPEQMPEQSPSSSNQNQSQNQNQDPPINNGEVVIPSRVSPTRARGAMGSSYASQSQIAYSYRGHTLSRGDYFNAFVERFDGDVQAFTRWLDAEIDKCYARGEAPGKMFSFIDERWEKRAPKGGARQPSVTPFEDVMAGHWETRCKELHGGSCASANEHYEKAEAAEKAKAS